MGLCIGCGGCVIKYMEGATNTRIQIPPSVQNPGDLYRLATVYGPTMEACQLVQSMIQRIVTEQSSAGVISGNSTAQSPFSSSFGPQQQQQQSQGYAIQQQQQSQVSVPPWTTNEYTQPFFRLAYYYGEDAAWQYLQWHDNRSLHSWRGTVRIGSLALGAIERIAWTKPYLIVRMFRSF